MNVTQRIEMHVDLEAISLFESKNVSEYWGNINTAIKCPKLREAAEPFLLAFPISCMAEAGRNHVNALLTKQRNRLKLQSGGYLRLNLINYQPNINDLAAAHQTQASCCCPSNTAILLLLIKHSHLAATHQTQPSCCCSSNTAILLLLIKHSHLAAAHQTQPSCCCSSSTSIPLVPILSYEGMLMLFTG